MKFNKLIALGGAYDIKSFVNGYYDMSVYFHNPVDYLQNMHDHHTLERLRGMDLRFVTGENDICKDANFHIHHILNSKAVHNQLDLWLDGTGHVRFSTSLTPAMMRSAHGWRTVSALKVGPSWRGAARESHG